MKGRYLAILSRGTVEQADALASHAAAQFDYSRRAALGSVIVLTDDAMPLDSGQSDRVIVGRPLRRDGVKGVGHDAASNEASQSFIDLYWGDYVAFVRPGGATSVDVIRAPSGRLHAFRAQRGALTLIASDIDVLIGLGAATGAIDWTFVAHHLAFPHLSGALTGLAGVDELFPGDATSFHAGGIERRLIWSPWRFADPSVQFSTIEAATDDLRATLIETIAALAAPYRAILLELSGGLDSSIVATCLRDVAAKVTAVNMVTPGPEGDERRYARLVADRTSIFLATAMMSADIDLRRPGSGRTPRPGIPAMLDGIDGQLSRAATEKRSDAFFGGTGGDSVFCSLGSSSPAADALRAFGFGSRFIRTVAAVATIHDINLWSAAWLAIRFAKRPAHPPWPRTTRFLHADRLPPAPQFHPWLLEPIGALGGTRSHIRSIMAALAHLDDYGRHAVAPSVFPLLAQPVIEACLRIPTWMWVEGGRDRAVARRAFAGDLPTEVINRRTKGAIDALCVEVFQKNRAALRPFLLDGHLAASGLIDCPQIEAYLTNDGPIRDDLFYYLLPIVDTEVWLRGWPDPGTPG